MKKSIFFIILAMSFALVFSQGKPCCKNKSGIGKLSCKINHAQIDAKGNGEAFGRANRNERGVAGPLFFSRREQHLSW